ncbi:unnamed protein product [Adineta ricciae]|uniref:Uncharacterized protein n=1 Tax=Adineta ricciae TaxID=249248 RepID=A0A816CIT4_ADIRI|nr:unnamed protein product [Adineta ricciae]
MFSSNQFFTLYEHQLHTFDHLRSLDLSGITNTSFSQVIDHLIESMPQLAITLLKIRDHHPHVNKERVEHSIRFLTTLQNIRQISLQKPDILLALMSTVPTIGCVSLESCTIKDVRKIKEYLPNLRSFTVQNVRLEHLEDALPGTTSSKSVLNIDHNRITFKFTELPTTFMKKVLFNDLQMVLSNLTCLSLQSHASQKQNFDEFFDGSWWESSLKTSAPFLKEFVFEFFYGYDHRELTVEKMNAILMPFRTDFWLKEKHWYVYLILSHTRGSRLFTNEFLRDMRDMTDVNSLVRGSTDQLFDTLSETTTALTIDYSAGTPSPTSLRFGAQVIDLYIRGPQPLPGSPVRCISLKNHIQPYVDYCNVKRLRLGACLVREDKKQLKAGLLKLFRNVTCLKIDCMEQLQSLFNQREKVLNLLKNQIYLLVIVAPINWGFWRDRRAIDTFCQMFANLKQLDLNVSAPEVMAIIIDALLNLEEAIFRFPESTSQILQVHRDLCLSRTRLKTMHGRYEIFSHAVHLFIDISGAHSDNFTAHQRILSRSPDHHHPTLSGME